MKIALVVPVFETIPTSQYGGVEFVVVNLARGLGSKGHVVDVFTTSDSIPNILYHNISVADKSVKSLPEINRDLQTKVSYNLRALGKTASIIHKSNYDIIHNHADWEFMIFSDILNKPIVTTHHNVLLKPFRQMIFSQFPNQKNISISMSQRKALPNLNWIANIYNSLSINEFPFNPNPKSHMLFLARMSRNKGAIEAATVAHKTKHLLHVAARVDVENEQYFNEFKPYIDNQFVQFIGELNFHQKIEYLSNARCLLVPINWEEPFGLYLIEAMACGTPVITMARGAIPEVIKDGETGFIINPSDDDNRGNWIIKKTGIEGLCEAVERIYTMPDADYKKMREAARNHVEKNFTAERMVDEYERAYNNLLS